VRVSRTLPAGCRSRRKIAGPRRSPLPRKADHAKHVDNNVRRCRRPTSPPRQMEANRVQPRQVDIAEEALRDIIQHYTREAGVRNFEREIGKTLRHAAVRIAEGQTGRIQIARENLADILGAGHFASLVVCDAFVGELTRGSLKTIPASEETTNTQRSEEDFWLTTRFPASGEKNREKRVLGRDWLKSKSKKLDKSTI
jgi:hypothetical protein